MTRNTDMHQAEQNPRFEAALQRALETPPPVAVPEAFAARVRSALPKPASLRQRASAGRQAGLAAAVILLLAVFWLAPHTAPHFTSLAFDMEILLLLELAGVMAWLARLRKEL